MQKADQMSQSQSKNFASVPYYLREKMTVNLGAQHAPDRLETQRLHAAANTGRKQLKTPLGNVIYIDETMEKEIEAIVAALRR
jgi:hypothetical protein